MSRKVFISFLGTTEYMPVYYTINGKRVTNHQTRFIQEALITHFCYGWGKDDAVMIFRTEKSNNDNWKDRTTYDGRHLKGLQSILLEMIAEKRLKANLNAETSEAASDIDTYMIPEGFVEEQVWTIFAKVFNKLQPGDHVWFDMTHAFRSIPLFAIVLFNYSRILKDVTIEGVHYGAFEALGPIFEVRQKSDAEKAELEAPIVDMTPVVNLQLINMAAQNFKDFGSLVSTATQLLNAADINRALKTPLSNIAQSLLDLDLFLQTNSLPDIIEGEYMREINTAKKEIIDTDAINHAYKGLIEEIANTLSKVGFSENGGWANAEAAIRWAIRQHMLVQAYSLAKEYLVLRLAKYIAITKFCCVDPDINIASKYIDISRELLLHPKKKYNGRLSFQTKNEDGTPIKWNVFGEYRKVAETLLNEVPGLYEIAKAYSQINYHRNGLDHCAMLDSGYEPLFDIKEYQDKIAEWWDIIQDGIYGWDDAEIDYLAD